MRHLNDGCEDLILGVTGSLLRLGVEEEPCRTVVFIKGVVVNVAELLFILLGIMDVGEVCALSMLVFV